MKMEVTAMEEKNRRIGKFNIVDIVVLLILVVGVVLLGVKFLGGEKTAVGTPTRIEYTVLVRAVHPDVCETIMGYKKANAQLMANGALVDGYVTDITYEPHINYGENDEGLPVISREEGEDARMDMVFTIQAAVDSPVTNKVGTQEVRIGKGHIVKTTEFELEGYSTTILTREVIQ